MTIESLREYCLAKPGVSEDFPFDETTLVFRVMGKMFLLTDLEDLPLRMNVKCDPEQAIALRDQYDAVIPGYHMNKTHWNTVYIDGRISDRLLREWIDHSYSLIRDSLPKKLRAELDSLSS